METKHTTAALTTQDLERERERQYCELCGKLENLLKCGRCRNSFYCSKAHQTQHWKTHKLICKESVAKSQVSKETPAERQAPSGDWEKGQTLPQQKTCAASRSGETIMKGFITNAESAVSSVDKPGWSNNHTKPNGQTTTRSTTQKLAREYIVPCMTKHGICVVDNFLGGETGLAILEDVKVLHKTVKFTDGQLVSQKSDSIKDIRGDKITWIEGRESGCEKIRFLMSHMDDLARHCNGQLGNFTINVRTKIMPHQVLWLAIPEAGGIITKGCLSMPLGPPQVLWLAIPEAGSIITKGCLLAPIRFSGRLFQRLGA
ncbi:egl nine homolog 1-like [Salvelinus sp. IW2-2015]|uniref:egl nine homolog 1-like n=1 Tax=Salvelinus sp. IW2-2015 TaxID=2691554 RepID=UPI0038D3CCAF